MKARAVRSGALALLPLSAAIGYTVVLIVLAETMSGRPEAAALTLWWIVSALGIAWVGGKSAEGNAEYVPTTVLALAVPLVAAPLALTSLLGERSVITLAVLAGWAALLAAVTALVGRIRSAGIRSSAAVTVGLLLIVVVPFLSALLHLPGEQVSARSAPWWTITAVTDHAFVGSDVLDRLRAVDLLAGLAVYVTLGTAFVLGYLVGTKRARSSTTDESAAGAAEVARR